MKTICIEVEEPLMEMAEKIKEATGEDIQSYLADKAVDFAAGFANERGKLLLWPAEYRDYDNEDQWFPCVFIGRTTVYGKPYAELYVDGDRFKAPFEYVRFPEGAKG